MVETLISVIVPIYQIDRYVGLCIESIINQTYRNLEIILVDDGSQDRSAELCDLYAQKDKRIVVIHKKNGGLVSARKAGLEVARGQFVGYVDGDDWIESDFYEEMLNVQRKYNSDIVIAGMSKDLFSSSTKVASVIPAGNYEGERLSELKDNMLSYKSFMKIGVTTYVWNKLFNREKLLKHQMCVDNCISIGEDAAVTYPYLMECQRVSIIDNFSYHYRQREDSMLKQSTAYRDEVVGLKKLYGHLVDRMVFDEDSVKIKHNIRDFILGTCIIRSGGVIKEIREEYSPYNRDFYGTNIVVCNAGTFGQQLVRRIEENQYCNVVGWVDVDYREYRRCCLNVDPVEEIDFMEFDYVLLATVDGEQAGKLKENLIWRGIPEEKILTVFCPEEERDYLLNRYLNV